MCECSGRQGMTNEVSAGGGGMTVLVWCPLPMSALAYLESALRPSRLE